MQIKANTFFSSSSTKGSIFICTVVHFDFFFSSKHRESSSEFPHSNFLTGAKHFVDLEVIYQVLFWILMLFPVLISNKQFLVNNLVHTRMSFHVYAGVSVKQSPDMALLFQRLKVDLQVNSNRFTSIRVVVFCTTQFLPRLSFQTFGFCQSYW